MMGKKMHPVILVDGSDLSADRTFYLLRASLPVGDLALPLYDEVYP